VYISYVFNTYKYMSYVPQKKLFNGPNKPSSSKMECNFDLRCTYSFYKKFIFTNMIKEINYNVTRIFRHTMCIWQSFVVNRYFSALCKKDKNMSRVNLYFSTKFYLCYLSHTKSQFFVKQLGWRISCEEVHATFFFWIFNNLNCI
jgi:hypothetical protein